MSAQDSEDLKKMNEKLTTWIGSIFHENSSALSMLSSSVHAVADLLDALKKYPEFCEKTPDVKSALNYLKDFKRVTPTLVETLKMNLDMAAQQFRADKVSGLMMTFQIQDMLKEFMTRYPFRHNSDGSKESDKVHLNIQHNFEITIDSELFFQLLANLTKNALAAMKKAGKGEIYIDAVSAQPGENFHTLTVKDTATGMPPEVLSHLFEKFFTQTRGGTGLGLYLCKKIMQFFGGSIECQAVLGEYSEFTLKFPLNKT